MPASHSILVDFSRDFSADIDAFDLAIKAAFSSAVTWATDDARAA